jgi:hypothetical protein
LLGLLRVLLLWGIMYRRLLLMGLASELRGWLCRRGNILNLFDCIIIVLLSRV